MVQMRGQKTVEAAHDPLLDQLDRPILARVTFLGLGSAPFPRRLNQSPLIFVFGRLDKPAYDRDVSEHHGQRSRKYHQIAWTNHNHLAISF